jgi:hypothetical protein
MTITLNSDYDVTLSTALLGYVGETNARPVSVEGLTVDGADRYVLTIDYGDGVTYEVDITGGTWTPTADILRSAQTVSCQLCAKKLSGQEYILLKKSRIFRLRIGAAIGDNAVPSPSVAADALDRIDAIGRQAHADMQTAVTAAETATTAAENAEKSATTAGVSADTATQAASRAETAKASAETSATQAETAMQGAETARAEAVKSHNNAKISAAQASTSAQQTEADKTITAGYAKTAKTCADSTAADRQAVQTLAEQVTADKATVAENATKVAEDRTAAETAAQKAQSVADSLPEDYVTAVGKIAENTAEISAVKLTDKELKRRVDALYSIGQGVTHRFETDTDTAYAKTVPTGAKLMSVKSVGGRSIVWNQLVQSTSNEITGAGVKATFSNDGIVTLNGTATTTGNAVSVQPVKNQKGHKYLMVANPLSGVYGKDQLLFSSQSYGQDSTGHGAIITNESSNAKWYYTLYVYKDVTYDNVKLQPQIFDLTQMFGAGNEPSTVEEFEKMFPADYYPYTAGEIVSAGTESIVEQGKNLFNFNSAKLNKSYRYISDVIPDGKKAVMSLADKDTSVDVSEINIGFANDVCELDSNVTEFNWVLTNSGLNSNNSNVSYVHDKSALCRDVFIYPKTDEALAKLLSRYDIQVELGDTPTAYAPYHRNTYPIPEAIKALPGYGWSAGTARNYVDYENKKYVQCVDSVDLGSLTWRYSKMPFGWGDNQWFSAPIQSIKVIPTNTQLANVLCKKYTTRCAYVADGNDFFRVDKSIGQHQGVARVTVLDTACTDATAFKQAMQGVILYYELATPIVTDISSLIPDDFLRNIEVEAKGSVTFKNSNGDDYRIPVPSEEEYIVKLSEVGGTT